MLVFCKMNWFRLSALKIYSKKKSFKFCNRLNFFCIYNPVPCKAAAYKSLKIKYFLFARLFFGLSIFKTSACVMFVYSGVYVPTLPAPNLDLLCNIVHI